MHTCVSVCMCVHVCTYLCMRACVYVYADLCVYAYMCVCVKGMDRGPAAWSLGHLPPHGDPAGVRDSTRHQRPGNPALITCVYSHCPAEPLSVGSVT